MFYGFVSDLFVFLSASSAGVTNLMAHDTFVLDVSLRIENAGDDEVPEGLNGQDNLYIEVSGKQYKSQTPETDEFYLKEAPCLFDVITLF